MSRREKIVWAVLFLGAFWVPLLSWSRLNPFIAAQINMSLLVYALTLRVKFGTTYER